MSVIVNLPRYEEITREQFSERKAGLRRQSGVYVLLDRNNRTLYVGKSVSLGNRLGSHLSGNKTSIRFYQNIRSIRIYLCTDPFIVDVYETYLIHKLKPRYNRDKMFFAEHVEVLREKLEGTEHHLRELTEERDMLLRELDTFSDIEEDEFYDEGATRYELSSTYLRLRQIEAEVDEALWRQQRLRQRHSIASGDSRR